MQVKSGGIRWVLGAGVAVATALSTATLAAHAANARASSLQDQVNDLVDVGFEEPQRAIGTLKALRAQRGQSPGSRRMIAAGIGLVAADHNLDDEARAAVAELEGLVPTAGPLAQADALLVRADLEILGNSTPQSVADLKAAVLAYAPYCDPALASDTRSCNPFNWFYANMFAGVAVSEQDARSTAAMYLSTASEIARRAKRPDLEARATAFMAELAQSEGNEAVSDRSLRRADDLAERSGDASAREFVKMFETEILQARGNFAGALRALQQARQIAQAAGHDRRAKDLVKTAVELDLQSGHPEAALAEVERVLPLLEDHQVDFMKDTLSTNRIVALLRLGRLEEGRRLLPPLLDYLDGTEGLVERSGFIDKLGEALLAAGDAEGAKALFDRERASILAGSERHFERLMLDRQAAAQARQLLQRREEVRWWSSIVGVALSGLLAVGAIVLWQRSRHRRLEHVNDALRIQSERDALTGLLNRDGLMRALRLQDRVGAFSGTLLLIDIDHFKRVNDTVGHAGGDAVLREVARRLQSCVREADFVVRWGGEELVVAILATPFDADALVDRIMLSLAAAPVSFQERSIPVSASIGYGTFPLDLPEVALSFDESLAVADAGMYYAKRHGRSAAVRVVALPRDLLSDLGGLPAALERQALDGSVRLCVRRVSDPALSSQVEGTGAFPMPLGT
jgi:diguanylate cyclase (GGDEF)-like protein